MEIKLEINDLKNLFRRRKKIFIIPFLLIFIAALAVSYNLPPVYQSEATILVEGQKISEDYVTTTTSSFVEERIEIITRQIMRRANLMQIINQFNLYPEMRDQATDFELLDKLREGILLETIDTDVYNRKSGRQIVATLAFTVSYQGNDPGMVQKVTNKLASLYVERDLKERERNAASTTEYFQVELEEIKHKIEGYEEEISKFKQVHFEEMPEYNTINIQAVAQLEREYDRIHIRIRTLQNKKINLEGRLAGVNPSTTLIVDKNNMSLNPGYHLKQLRFQLMDLRLTLSDKHPDIKKLKRAIKALEAEGNNSDDSAIKRPLLKELDDQLTELHTKPGQSNEEKPDNPVYLNLQIQIIGVKTEIQTLSQEQQETKKEIEAYRRKIGNAPLVEKEYSELTRDYEGARQRYREISNKLMKAKFARGMDESQQSTSFQILESAYFPQKPSKPNRKAIALLGFFIAFSGGFVLAVFSEYMDMSIKTKDELASLTGIPVFAVVPFVESRSNSPVRKLIWSCATLLAFFTSLWLIHRYISPIDILWTEYGKLVIERFSEYGSLVIERFR